MEPNVVLSQCPICWVTVTARQTVCHCGNLSLHGYHLRRKDQAMTWQVPLDEPTFESMHPDAPQDRRYRTAEGLEYKTSLGGSTEGCRGCGNRNNRWLARIDGNLSWSCSPYCAQMYQECKR